MCSAMNKSAVTSRMIIIMKTILASASLDHNDLLIICVHFDLSSVALKINFFKVRLMFLFFISWKKNLLHYAFLLSLSVIYIYIYYIYILLYINIYKYVLVKF